MLDADLKKLKENLFFKLSNAQDLELQWEAKAYSDCITMLDNILKKHGMLN
jgi:hypothetical protein